MYAALRCLEEHDLSLVGWALVACLTSMAVGVNAYHRATTVIGAQRWAWVVLTSVILASGVWATHFIAMLGFQPGLRLSFDGSQTGLSFVAILAGLVCGMSVAIGSTSATQRALGGAICGISIAAMHYVGVAAMRLPAIMVWEPKVVAMSLVVATVLSAMAFRDLTREAGFGKRLVCALILVCAVCGLHFVGMASVTLVPADVPDSVGRFTRGELAQLVGVMVAVIVLAGAGMLATFGLASRSAFGTLRSALSRAPVGLAYFNRDSLLQVWNETLSDFTKPYNLTLVRGMSLAEIGDATASDANSRQAIQAVLDAVGGGEWVSPDTFASPDGRFQSVKLTPAQDGGFLLIVTDVTEHVAVTEREIEARRLAESASRAKSQFLANMSHEIRTPLNGILGMVQVMEREGLDSAQRDRLEIIGASGGALLEILNHVLDLSKIEAGKMELEDAPFDLDPTVRLAVAPYAPLAAEKGLDLSVRVDSDVAGLWRGDAARLRQILSNLVVNAVKFTSEGWVEVSVEGLEEGLRFKVSDTGIGVSPADSERIFEAFTQADASATRRHGGTGLGLTISRSLAERMGGTIWLESGEGKGSTFGVDLPLTPVQPDDGGEAETPFSGRAGPHLTPKGNTLRILAAEDNPVNQAVLKALLEPFDIELRLVADGEQAVAAYAADPLVDMILMDVQMPVLNGLRAAEAIRALEASRGLPSTPIIALTANAMPHQIETYFEAGMNAFVAKPVNLGELLTAIDTVGASAEAA